MYVEVFELNRITEKNNSMKQGKKINLIYICVSSHDPEST